MMDDAIQMCYQLEDPLEHLSPEPELPPSPELLLEPEFPPETELPPKLEPQSTPLVFNDVIDTSNMTNVLLIDSTLVDKQVFYDSANAKTFPIIYNYNSKTDDLLALFRQKFPASSIQRISLVFHDRGTNFMPAFMNNKLLFDETDLASGQTSFTENVSFLITCMNEFHVGHIDFLACNTLQYSNWKSYYALLASHTSVVVGASNDQTGNLNHGGDWIMESTNENVRDLYFNENISNYASTLAAINISADGASQAIYLQMSTPNIQYSIGTLSAPGSWETIASTDWPVTFTNSNATPGPTNILRVAVTQALTISNTYGNTLGYFIAGSSYVTFDGSGNTITMNSITSYPGLIQNGSSSVAGKANVVVQNFTTAISGSSLASEAGWLCKSYFGRGVSGNQITGCTNSGDIVSGGSYAGGIAGAYAGYAGSLTITNCTNTGTLISNNGNGGITGALAGGNSGSLTITGCTNTGNINSWYSGGIVGQNAGETDGLVTITNCVSIGTISTPYSGGIAGHRFGYNTSNTCAISGCYSTGSISGSYAGGIVGAGVGYNNNALYTPVVNITNSYSLGAIASTSGGICGGYNGPVYTNTPSITITNCYSAGTIVNANSGIVSTSYPKPTTQTNVYAAQGTRWVNDIANANLTGTPTNFNTPGITWTMVSPGNPYVLSLYNAQLYSPNNASGITPYTSAGSVFGSVSGYTYRIININQVANVATTKVFAYKGSIASPYAYNYNTFTFTDTNGVLTRGKMSSSISSSTGVLTISKSANNISANGATQSIYLRMSGVSLQYSVGSTPGSWTTISTWPMTLTNSNSSPGPSSVLRVVATQALTISSSTGGTNGYFIAGSPYITFDGSGNTITISSIPSYPGLIQNGSSIEGTNGFSNIVVQNFITAISGTSTLATSGCWLCQYYFGRNVSGNAITNCTNNGNISSGDAAGIVGSLAGSFGGSLTITNCTNNGTLTGNGSTGIAGYQVASNGGSVTITGCTNNGAISITDNGSGITGRDAGILGGSVTIINCTNTGAISRAATGGIVGDFAGSNGGSVTITGCTNSGALSGGASPIVGSSAGSTNGRVTITNCWNSGTLSSGISGIASSRFGYNTNQTCSITNCYNISNISSSSSGGIVGSSVGYSDNALYTGSVNISNCYSLGTIGSGCGGIVGGWSSAPANKPTLTITNCYSYGTIVDANSGIVASSLTSTYVNLTQTNTYAAAGGWTDASANANLTGTPTNINTNNPGITWAATGTDGPYILSLYNAALYSPSSATASTPYTSSASVFGSTSGYTYTLVNTSQTGSTSITRVLVYKGTAPYYNSYNFNTFTFTNSAGSTPLSSSVNSSNGQISYYIPNPLTISADGATQSVYLRMSGSTMQYSTDNQVNWNSITIANWPVTITNSNASPGPSSLLRVIATQTLTISSSYGNTSGYFIAGSSYVTLDGSGNTININNITSYPGLIQNGTSTTNGYANIVVQNFTTAISGSTLATEAGWVGQSYFGKGVTGNQITGCLNTGAISSIYAGGIVGAYAGSSGGLLNITNCSNIGSASSSFTGGIAGYRFGYNTNNTCTITGCYSTGTISGSNAGGIVGADVGYNDNASYTPVINITNSYSLGTIATTCGGICGGTDGSVYTNTPSITITNCYSSGTIVNPNSGIVSTSYPKPTTQTNVYAAEGRQWVNDIANANLTGTPTNFNTPGSTWTMIDALYPYVLSLYNSQLYSPNNASSTTPYTSAGSVFGSSSGYSYIIININQVANVATMKVFAYKGTAPNYYSYNYNTFIFTDTNGVSSPGKMSSSISLSTGVLTISKSANNISADGATQSIYLQMDGVSMQYSVGSTPGSWTTISTWPMTLTNSNSSPGPSSVLRVVATQALSISSSTGGTNGYFIAGSPYITFDGSGNTITISSISLYPGLIQNGSNTAGTNGFANIVVQNFITAISGGSTLATSAGWLCQQYFGRNVSGNAITGCTNSSTGVISATSAGGIAGQSAGRFGGSITFTNCTNNGDITGSRASGIAGESVGARGGSVTFTGCTNNGLISAQFAGGITGLFAGQCGLATITNCTNNGSINGIQSGGIIGPQAAQDGGSITISNCTNTGTIVGSAGGIAGTFSGQSNGLVTLTNCFSIGLISGQYAGGITGYSFGYNTSRNCVISQCYSTGDISGNNAGGIVGASVGTSNNALYTANVNITNCYSLGAISATAGGICGGYNGTSYTNKATIGISNCYSYGTLTGTATGLVAAALTSTYINLTTTKTYVAGFVGGTNWTDASANASLTGTPTSIALGSGGTTWTSISANVPYLLTSFFSLTNPTQIYTPNNVSSSSKTYTSSPGAYSPGIYSILSTSQPSGSTIIANVAAVAGTSPTYYGYYNNIFTWTSLTDSGSIAASINPSSGVLEFNLTDPPDPPSQPYPCFLEGTKILCFENNQEVYRPVESLRKGDLVKTIYNGYMPINMIGTTSLYNPGNDYRVANRLYKCPKERYPTLFEDLYITGCHSILVPSMTDDQWENTKAVNGNIYVTDNHFRLIACADEKAEPFNKEGFMNIYHIALEHHEICMNYGIYANGLLVESCSIDYLIKYSNLKIMGQDTRVTCQEMPNNMNRQLVDTC